MCSKDVIIKYLYKVTSKVKPEIASFVKYTKTEKYIYIS